MILQKIIKPARLRKGDAVGIVSPSSSIAQFPRRTARAVSYLQKSGFRVLLMPNALANDGYSAGTPSQRANDINDAFAHSDVSAIVCSTGGLTANAVLPFLDYDLIRKKPKIFCGFSDITTLLLAITAKSGIVTFHGPTLLPSFGDYEGPVGFTESHFTSIASTIDSTGNIPVSNQYAAENLYWDRDDKRSLLMKKSEKINVFGPRKKVTGTLIGGNLQTIVMLLRTEFMPVLDNSILFLEEEGLSTAWYERYLVELARDGIFSHISGLVFAKPSNSFREDSLEKRSLFLLLQEIAEKYHLPILANVDCGHTKPLLTFPLGIHAELNTSKKTLAIIEGAVL